MKSPKGQFVGEREKREEEGRETKSDDDDDDDDDDDMEIRLKMTHAVMVSPPSAAGVVHLPPSTISPLSAAHSFLGVSYL